MWESNNILSNNRQIKEEVTNEIRKYFETDENEDTVQKKKKKKNFQSAVKAVLRGKFIALNAYVGKEGSYQIKILIFNLTIKRRES